MVKRGPALAPGPDLMKEAATMTLHPKGGRTFLAGLALLLAAGPARADDDVSFKKHVEAEKRFVTAVGKAVVKAAHGTGKKAALVKYEFTKPKPNRTELVLKMEYYGLVSDKKYVADIVIKIDSSNKDAWEVLNIDYTDNNTMAYNAKKVQELIKRLNK
jgi:hypothetical protein